VNFRISSRQVWWIWFAVLALFIALAIFPVSYRVTRATGVALACGVWFGFIGLVWRRHVLRFVLLGVTVLVAGFLALPSRGDPPPENLRREYLAALRRYEGVRYYWGGENSRGIDCSGLVRRGLIDALLRLGVRTLDAGLVRRAITLWWHDSTAAALGDGHRELTVRILSTPSINALDHSRVLPGDLAVTESGIHVLAYLGDQQWIEADPTVGKVITVSAPAHDNAWFAGPMNVVRWSVLE
jgi:hypothetical protein